MSTENNTNTVDLLKIKIDKARSELSEESRSAIDAIDWKNTIIGMRTEKGYSFTQIEDLEIETELLLCGLLNPEDYPKELEKRMGIPKPQIDELVNEMNTRVFEKIRQELVKNLSKNKTGDTEYSENIESREEMIKHIETPNLLKQKELTAPQTNTETPPIRNDEGSVGPSVSNGTGSILEQKLSGVFQAPKTETNHSLNNLNKTDPYREIPE